jgi:mannose-6-phosphate isomerase-like protein (cupin superfamily)
MNEVKVVEVKSTQAGKNPHGVESKSLYNTEHATVTHLALRSGEQLKRHITPTDVFFYVLEGWGVVEVGDEQMEVGPDTLIESPKGIPHCWYNRSSNLLRFLVCNVPRQSELTKIL